MKMRIPKLLLLLFVCLSIVACNSGKTNESKATKLATPTNLQISGTTLTWTAVANASGYKVDIGGTEYDASGALYSLSALPSGAYQIKVMAKGNETDFTDSNWSTAISYTFTPTVLYNMPAGLVIDIEIRDESGSRLGIITKDVLTHFNQVVVPDNATRHWVAYSLPQLLAHIGIGSYTSATGEAADGYNATALFNDAYIAVVRVTTATGAVESGSNFPRFLGGSQNVQNVKIITLAGKTNGSNETPSGKVEFSLENMPNFEIRITCETGIQHGVITKATLAPIDQVRVEDPQNPARYYVAYPLTKILAPLALPAVYTSAEGLANDGYDATGKIDETYIGVVRMTAGGEVEATSNFPRFLAPSGANSNGRAPVVSNVTSIILIR